jgi:cyclophilin family peptidyl-prolyl cis-trans isomerase
MLSPFVVSSSIASLLLLAIAAGVTTKFDPNNARAPAQAAPPAAPAAAPQEKKDVPANADPIAQVKKFIDDKKIDTTAKDWKTKLPKPPQLTFDPKKTYTWVMETNQGTMKFKLLPDVAPMHVSACMYLNTLGFYNGLGFHRVLTGFMAQGGDPLGTGGGTPGYQLHVELKEGVKHDKAGVLSTARRGGDLDSDGSQFFVMFAPAAGLDMQYSIYGTMTEGEDVLKKIESLGKRSESAANPARPTQPITITKGTIEVTDAK